MASAAAWVKAARGNDAPKVPPAHKIIPTGGTGFMVDGFRYGTYPAKAWFLTHAHSDHYTGLSETWSTGLIYCSEVTARLLQHLVHANPQYIRPLEMNMVHTIQGVQVVLVEANHCPGAVQMLFTLSDGRRYLHCGDMRFHPSLLDNPYLATAKGVNAVYLDTTYCAPKYGGIPAQEGVIEYVAATVAQILQPVAPPIPPQPPPTQNAGSLQDGLACSTMELGSDQQLPVSAATATATTTTSLHLQEPAAAAAAAAAATDTNRPGQQDPDGSNKGAMQEEPPATSVAPELLLIDSPSSADKQQQQQICDDSLTDAIALAGPLLSAAEAVLPDLSQETRIIAGKEASSAALQMHTTEASLTDHHPNGSNGVEAPGKGPLGSTAATSGSFRRLILISTYVIGKERILLAVHERTGLPIYVTPTKQATLSVCLSASMGREAFARAFTTDPAASPIHVCGWGFLGETWPFFRPNYANMEEYRQEHGAEELVAFCPTGWMHEMKKKTVPIRSKPGCASSVHLVPYSEHSNFSELVAYVKFLRPQQVIPTVGVDGDDSDKNRRSLLRHFQAFIDNSASKARMFAGRSNSSTATTTKSATTRSASKTPATQVKAEVEQDEVVDMTVVEAVQSGDPGPDPDPDTRLDPAVAVAVDAVAPVTAVGLEQDRTAQIHPGTTVLAADVIVTACEMADSAASSARKLVNASPVESAGDLPSACEPQPDKHAGQWPAVTDAAATSAAAATAARTEEEEMEDKTEDPPAAVAVAAAARSAGAVANNNPLLAVMPPAAAHVIPQLPACAVADELLLTESQELAEAAAEMRAAAAARQHLAAGALDASTKPSATVAATAASTAASTAAMRAQASTSTAQKAHGGLDGAAKPTTAKSSKIFPKAKSGGSGRSGAAKASGGGGGKAMSTALEANAMPHAKNAAPAASAKEQQLLVVLDGSGLDLMGARALLSRAMGNIPMAVSMHYDSSALAVAAVAADAPAAAAALAPKEGGAELADALMAASAAAAVTGAAAGIVAATAPLKAAAGVKPAAAAVKAVTDLPTSPAATNTRNSKKVKGEKAAAAPTAANQRSIASFFSAKAPKQRVNKAAAAPARLSAASAGTSEPAQTPLSTPPAAAIPTATVTWPSTAQSAVATTGSGSGSGSGSGGAHVTATQSLADHPGVDDALMEFVVSPGLAVQPVTAVASETPADAGDAPSQPPAKRAKLSLPMFQPRAISPVSTPHAETAVNPSIVPPMLPLALCSARVASTAAHTPAAHGAAAAAETAAAPVLYGVALATSAVTATPTPAATPTPTAAATPTPSPTPAATPTTSPSATPPPSPMRTAQLTGLEAAVSVTMLVSGPTSAPTSTTATPLCSGNPSPRTSAFFQPRHHASTAPAKPLSGSGSGSGSKQNMRKHAGQSLQELGQLTADEAKRPDVKAEVKPASHKAAATTGMMSIGGSKTAAPAMSVADAAVAYERARDAMLLPLSEYDPVAHACWAAAGKDTAPGVAVTGHHVAVGGTKCGKAVAVKVEPGTTPTDVVDGEAGAQVAGLGIGFAAAEVAAFGKLSDGYLPKTFAALPPLDCQSVRLPAAAVSGNAAPASALAAACAHAPAPYLHVAAALGALDSTTKRLKIAEALTNMFRSLLALAPADVLPAVYLTLGRIAPEYEGLELSVGDATVAGALIEATGASKSRMRELHRGLGDLGDVAQALRRNQSMLRQPTPLTVRGLYAALRTMALDKGQGAAGRRQGVILNLLRSARDTETKYLVRTLIRNLRVGANWRSVLGPLAKAVLIQSRGLAACSKAGLQEAADAATSAYHLCPSFDVLVPVLMEGGPAALRERCVLRPGVPLKPMLAKICEGVADGIRQLGPAGHSFLAEYKYDGQRAQVHLLSGGQVRVFSRNEEDRTASFPDVAQMLRQAAASVGSSGSSGSSMILDAELVAVDRGGGKVVHAAAAAGVDGGAGSGDEDTGRRNGGGRGAGAVGRGWGRSRGSSNTGPKRPRGASASAGRSGGGSQKGTAAAIGSAGKAEGVAAGSGNVGGVAEEGGGVKLMAFQELSTRARGSVEEHEVTCQVCVFVFDLLYLNGESLLQLPLRQRRALIPTALPHMSPGRVQLAESIEVNTPLAELTEVTTPLVELTEVNPLPAEVTEVTTPLAELTEVTNPLAELTKVNVNPPLAGLLGTGAGVVAAGDDDVAKGGGIATASVTAAAIDVDADVGVVMDFEAAGAQKSPGLFQTVADDVGMQTTTVPSDRRSAETLDPAAQAGSSAVQGSGSVDPGSVDLAAAVGNGGEAHGLVHAAAVDASKTIAVAPTGAGAVATAMPLQQDAAALQPLQPPQPAADGGEGAEEVVYNYLLAAFAAGTEGLMLKRLDGPTSRYEPSKRVDAWIKVKRDYCEGLRDSLDLVVIGAWYGQGRKVTWFSPFLLAVWDPDAEEYQSMCRCMSGFSDAFYAEATERLSKTIVPKPSYYNTSERPSVWFAPTEVWELRGADLTLSPVHKAAVGRMHPDRGASLRFPRYIRSRPDKSPEDASTPDVVESLYNKQTRKIVHGGTAGGGGGGGGAAAAVAATAGAGAGKKGVLAVSTAGTSGGPAKSGPPGVGGGIGVMHGRGERSDEEMLDPGEFAHGVGIASSEGGEEDEEHDSMEDEAA